jgi:hypothetical protein
MPLTGEKFSQLTVASAVADTQLIPVTTNPSGTPADETITPLMMKTYVKTGLVSSDVGLGSVNNTSDAAKPVSTAQQTALDLKANIASPAFTGTMTFATRAITALRTLDATDHIIFANGTFTVTLPTAVSITGRVYRIKNTGTGTITIATTSSQTMNTVDGAVTTLLLSPGISFDLVSDGANWQVM